LYQVNYLRVELTLRGTRADEVGDIRCATECAAVGAYEELRLEDVCGGAIMVVAQLQLSGVQHSEEGALGAGYES
jgi:hypothetical protein